MKLRELLLKASQLQSKMKSHVINLEQTRSRVEKEDHYRSHKRRGS